MRERPHYWIARKTPDSPYSRTWAGGSLPSVPNRLVAEEREREKERERKRGGGEGKERAYMGWRFTAKRPERIVAKLNSVGGGITLLAGGLACGLVLLAVV
jgi:hypothetical protein